MRKRKTTEEFIVKAEQIHGAKYTYGKVNYINAKTKVIITCPIHGEFEQTPNNHLSGKGCAICSNNINSTTEEFTVKAQIIHNNKYDYSLVQYTNSKNKVVLICPEHGVFQQTPHDHLRGSGCTYCKYITIASKLSDNIEEFIQKAINVHGTKYDYSKSVYTNWDTNINIACPIHGEFNQRVGNHLNGKGCPNCTVSGFQPNKPAYLYYLKITTDTNQVLYKIGITNRTVNERFQIADLQKIEIVKQKLYENGQDALDWETKLKRMYKEYQYKGPDILSSGNTELFTEDIIELYYKG